MAVGPEIVFLRLHHVPKARARPCLEFCSLTPVTYASMPNFDMARRRPPFGSCRYAVVCEAIDFTCIRAMADLGRADIPKFRYPNMAAVFQHFLTV